MLIPRKKNKDYSALKITGAKYHDDFKLSVELSDGSSLRVDFAKMHNPASPGARAVQDISLYKFGQIVNGAHIQWPNGFKITLLELSKL